MADGQDILDGTVNRRQAIVRGVALSAAGAVAGSVALPAWATSTTDQRLSTYEGKYAIDGHKIVEGYFAAARGKSAMDVLIVIPGEGGLDDSVRDVVRRHALAGKVVFAPDLARMRAPFAGRAAVIADIVANAPRFKRHSRGTGIVKVVAA